MPVHISTVGQMSCHMILLFIARASNDGHQAHVTAAGEDRDVQRGNQGHTAETYQSLDVTWYLGMHGDIAHLKGGSGVERLCIGGGAGSTELVIHRIRKIQCVNSINTEPGSRLPSSSLTAAGFVAVVLPLM